MPITLAAKHSRAVESELRKAFLFLCLCAGLMLVVSGGSVAVYAQGAQPSGFTGLWTGTIRVIPCLSLKDRSRCNAINNVTFTFLQDESKITGHYTCAIGTQICRNGNADSNGKIVSGRVNGQNIFFTVIVPADVSSCRYSGNSTSPGHLRGGYNCYEGGGLVEQGSFDVTREGG
jgi:hypothetical protein